MVATVSDHDERASEGRTASPTFTVPLITDTPDLTEIGSVGRCAADRVASIATDDQV